MLSGFLPYYITFPQVAFTKYFWISIEIFFTWTVSVTLSEIWDPQMGSTFCKLAKNPGWLVVASLKNLTHKKLKWDKDETKWIRFWKYIANNNNLVYITLKKMLLVLEWLFHSSAQFGVRKGCGHLWPQHNPNIELRKFVINRFFLLWEVLEFNSWSRNLILRT